MINYIKKNFAYEISPVVSSEWKRNTKDERVYAVKEILKKMQDYKNYEVLDALDNGHVIFKILESIPASTRGERLLSLEEMLKSKIDEGITVWLDHEGDKSKLRNLRGIKFGSKKT